jgi:CubicO group peptidase (beta-lactamase class C family)
MKTPALLIALFVALSPVAVVADDVPDIPLPVAVMTGNLPAVERHISGGTDLDQRDDFGSTPLTIAAVFDRPRAAAALLAAGADPALTDPHGSTPLHIASLLGRTEVVGSLLAAGADRYQRSASGAIAYDYVAAPLPEDKAILETLGTQLTPLGFRLDQARLAAARPKIAAMLRPRAADLEAVSYAPVERDDFPVSTPQATGLDPMLVAELYRDAEALPRLYSVLIVKDGKLVAEKYFNDGEIDTPTLIQSAVKSVFSALVGLAHREGCLPDLDAPAIGFLPELAERISDPRKSGITIRQLLQMRSGLPWEETDPELWDQLLEGDHLEPFTGFPLVANPGKEFNYSNFSTDLLGVIVTRACKTGLRNFAAAHLMEPLGVRFGEWAHGKDYYYPILKLTPRTAARFAQLYLDGGRHDGSQVIPADWVSASLGDYSPDAWVTHERVDHAGRHLRDLGYGYQWWQATVGGHRINFAWGHGGQFYGLVHDLDMAVIVTAYPAWREHGAENWGHERAHLNLVGKFISLLP